MISSCSQTQNSICRNSSRCTQVTFIKDNLAPQKQTMTISKENVSVNIKLSNKQLEQVNDFSTW